MEATPTNAEGPWDDGGGAMVLHLVSSPPLSFPSLLQVKGGGPGRVGKDRELPGSLRRAKQGSRSQERGARDKSGPGAGANVFSLASC